jgi:hypothetical protein
VRHYIKVRPKALTPPIGGIEEMTGGMTDEVMTDEIATGETIATGIEEAIGEAIGGQGIDIGEIETGIIIEKRCYYYRSLDSHSQTSVVTNAETSYSNFIQLQYEKPERVCTNSYRSSIVQKKRIGAIVHIDRK